MAETKKTICHVLLSLTVGGAEMLAARLARRFRGDFRVVFACLDDLGTLAEGLREEGFTIARIGRRPGLDWSCARRLGDFLKRERVDLVHAHQYSPFFYSLVARLPGRRPPILFMEHGRSFPDHPRPKRMIVNRLLLGANDQIVGVGEAVRQALIRNEGFPARRVSVIHNGIDLGPFDRQETTRASARRRLDIPEEDLVLIQVARLDPLKDHPTALRAFRRVLDVRPDARLLLIGEGPEDARIGALIDQLGLGRNVRLLGLRTDVAELLPAADLFLLSSVSEGIPLTLIEAMAAALPVVATRVGGIPEVVENGRTGLLAAASDDDALARHILRIAADPDLAAALGRHGRQRARSAFGEDTMVSAYRSSYAKMFVLNSRHALSGSCLSSGETADGPEHREGSHLACR
jgi:glycosyltransferase involved in cell wall biosynthesis